MQRLLLPRSQVVAADGRPVSGAKLYTYLTGTSTPKAVYTDAALSIAHSNPVVADDAGRFPAMFLEGGTYKTVLTDANDVVIMTDDPVEGLTTSTSGGGGGGGSTTVVASPRNRIVNGAMQISQQNGTSNVDATTGANYTLDQWIAFLSSSPGGTLRVAQNATATPGGSSYRLRASVQSADASLAAGDYYVIQQPIEGGLVPDARFGTSAARQLVLRFGVRCSIAGTYGFSVTNSANNRSWVTTFVIAPSEINTDVVREAAIPGDVTGTWLTDTGVGLNLRWCLGAGTDFQGVAGWQAGNIKTTSSQTNFMASGGATFDLFDVGLYIDAAATGTAPGWEPPLYPEELTLCRRYWQPAYSSGRFNAAGAAQFYATHMYFPPMRIAPSMAIQSTVADRANIDAAYPTAGPVTNGSACINFVSAASGDARDIERLWWCNSRM